MVTTLPSSSKAGEARQDAEASEEPPPPYEALDSTPGHTATPSVITSSSSRVDEQVADLLNEHLELPQEPSPAQSALSGSARDSATLPLEQAYADQKTSGHQQTPEGERAMPGQYPTESYPVHGQQYSSHATPHYPQYPAPMAASHDPAVASGQQAGWASSVGTYFNSMGAAVMQRHDELQERRQDRRDYREERREARRNYRELKKEQRHDRREARREGRD